VQNDLYAYVPSGVCRTAYRLLCLLEFNPNYYAMVEKVIRQPLTAEVQIQYWANPCGISGGTRGTGSVFFSPRTSAFPCQYNSTNVPYSISHLPLMLYHLNNYQWHWVTPMWNKIWMSQ